MWVSQYVCLASLVILHSLKPLLTSPRVCLVSCVTAQHVRCDGTRRGYAPQHADYRTDPISEGKGQPRAPLLSTSLNVVL